MALYYLNSGINKIRKAIQNFDSEEYIQTKHIFSFKYKYPLFKRRDESKRLLTKYPDRIPIIVEINFRCKEFNDISHFKILIPNNFSVSHIIFHIRRKLQINPSESIYLFSEDNTMFSPSITVQEAYTTYKNIDGLLYISVSKENVFG